MLINRLPITLTVAFILNINSVMGADFTSFLPSATGMIRIVQKYFPVTDMVSECLPEAEEVDLERGPNTEENTNKEDKEEGENQGEFNDVVIEIDTTELEEQEAIRKAYSRESMIRRAKNFSKSILPATIAVGGFLYLKKDPMFLMVVGVAGVGIKDKIANCMGTLQNSICPNELTLKVEEMELNFRLKAKEMSEGHRRYLTEYFKNYHGNTRPRQGVRAEQKEEAALQKAEFLLSLPTKKKVIPESRSKTITENLERVMGKTFDASVVKNIKSLAVAIVVASNVEKGGKIVVFLYGPPGTGKTTTVKLLAQELGLPLIEYTLSNMNPKDLVASANGHMGEDQLAPCGRYAEGLSNKPFTNCIHFFDEVSDAMPKGSKEKGNGGTGGFQSILKEMFDPDRTEIMDQTLKTMLSTEDGIFIMAANFAPEDYGNALLDRSLIFRFPAASDDAKRITATNELKLAMQRHNYQDDALGGVDDKNFELICENYKKLGPEQGMRALQKVIGQYVLHLKAVSLGAITDPNFDIDQAFLNVSTKGLKTIE